MERETEYECIKCQQPVYDKYYYELYGYMCEDCYDFYMMNQEEEEDYGV